MDIFTVPIDTVAKALALVGVVVLMIAAAVAVLKKWRDADNNPSTTGDMLSNFREIHQSGQLSQQEYQQIRSRLSAKVQSELADKEDTQ